MDGYGKETYGERIATTYDRLDTHHDADLATGGAEETADFLVGLLDGAAAARDEQPPEPQAGADACRALELAIGTGRIALPLAARGIDVTGIDISPAMVDELRAKPGGTDIPVTIGDFADMGVDGAFDLVYLVFNTIFILSDAAEQQRCFTNVAAHLTAEGTFVVEAFVPDLDRFVDNQTLRVRSIAIDEVFLDASIHHPDSQHVDCQHIVIRPGEVSLYPVRLCYAWPAQLDELAAHAGLRLRERFQDWRRTPFTDASGFHVSVYEPA